VQALEVGSLYTLIDSGFGLQEADKIRTTLEGMLGPASGETAICIMQLGKGTSKSWPLTMRHINPSYHGCLHGMVLPLWQAS